MPIDTTVGDNDRIDRDDTSPDGIAKRLDSVARVMTNMNGRLEKIKAVLGSPPDDSKPPISDALNDIKTAANHAITLADEMLRVVSGPSPIDG